MTERGKGGKFVKASIAEEPEGSIILPADPVVVSPLPMHELSVTPTHLRTALQAEVAAVVAEPLPPVGGQRLSETLDWPLHEQKYYRAVSEVIAEKGWPTNAMIAAKLGITEKVLQRWRSRHPEVDGKVSRALERQVDELWGRVLHRAFVLAVRGSIDHMVFLAKVTRRLGPETEGPGGVNVQVNIRV